jgi:putative hydrolase of the HAD superfamily
MIKAVIFDVGGVLHTDEMKFVHRDIISILGITKKTFDESYKRLIPLIQEGKISEKQFWNWFLKDTNSKKHLPKKSLFIREFIKRYKVNNDVIKIVKSLKSQGYKLAVLSNTIKSHVEVNEKKGVYDGFSVRILSCEAALRKPDPKMFKLALRKLGAKFEETVFIDDKPEFVKAAKALGINGLVFKSSEILKNDLKALGLEVL